MADGHRPEEEGCLLLRNLSPVHTHPLSAHRVGKAVVMTSQPSPLASYKSASNRINVLVYSGPGVSETSLHHLKQSLRALLSTRYDVLSVTAESLINDPWTHKCALLCFPGGRDLGYVSALGEAGCERVSRWVRNEGGRYLGLCAGAYFASARVDFERGREGFEVRGERALRFFPGACTGAAYPGFVYDSEDGARDAVISLEAEELWDVAWPGRINGASTPLRIYHNGGGVFEELKNAQEQDVQVIARYEELPGRPPAGVLCHVGPNGGKALLWGVHPEHPSVSPLAAAAPSSSTTEEPRLALLRATLRMLDLHIPDDKRSVVGPTPLFLTSIDPADAQSLATDIAAKFPSSSANNGTAILADAHNTFTIHSQAGLAALHAEYPDAPSRRRRSMSDHTRLDLVVCSEGCPPAATYTPIFDIAAFQAHLQEGRRRLRFPYKPSFGSELLYGEVVTSTQTVLDKNPKFLSALPSGFVFVGSHQIAGRGRGANAWLSPPGCLQFSLVLRAPRALGSRLVFVQYLFGLAVVEAVRGLSGYEGVAMRLKWPNDLYVVMPRTRSATEPLSGGEEDLRKIGGILVNSFFAGGDFTIIIGCGINTTNSTPTTSLLDLIAAHNAAHGTAHPPITQEELLALILPRFEAFWARFSASGTSFGTDTTSAGDFSPFADAYTRRWLHAGKIVTVQATGQRVKILGLHPDNGTLRTIELDGDGRERAGQYVDLEPDGNSFDMMQGLLKVKR